MKSIILALVLIYLGLGLFLYLAQRSFIYFPVPAGLSNDEEVTFKSDGQQIKATVLNPGNRKSIIYFGGNAEGVAYNADSFTEMFADYTVYLVHYRGYGGSSGEPTEQGIYSDALHIYDVVKTRHDGVSVIGRSLGSAVATHLASERDVQKLILITPFDSAQALAQSQFPVYPMSLLLKDKHDSLSRAGRIKSEVMVIAAAEDKVIPMRHTTRLLEGFSQEVKFHVIEGAGHNDLSDTPKYSVLLHEFMSDTFAPFRAAKLIS